MAGNVISNPSIVLPRLPAGGGWLLPPPAGSRRAAEPQPSMEEEEEEEEDGEEDEETEGEPEPLAGEDWEGYVCQRVCCAIVGVCLSVGQWSKVMSSS